VPELTDRATDEAAFARLLESHGAALRRISRAYARTAADQEDLHQEICLQLWRSLPSFQGKSAIGTWLYRVALNTALSWQRTSRRRKQHDEALAHEPSPSSTGETPRDEKSILEEFLSALAPVDRIVLVLYMEALTIEEIADVAGVSPGAVSVRLHRIRKHFTDRYLNG